MLIYLNQTWHQRKLNLISENRPLTVLHLRDSILEGAGMRVRPVMMTVSTVIIGLVPIIQGSGTGSQVMQRIAAPMIGGMISALLLTLLVLPAIIKR
jgi:Cu(I)/Ag(I) efflux system membrane protein CusA/SilA